MKCFLKGVAGAVLLLIASAIIIPGYSDYSDRIITNEMLSSVKPLQAAIEIQLGNDKEINVDVTKYNLSTSITTIRIGSDGAITVQGGKHGQVFILTPTSISEATKWHCMGGNYHAMPALCKNT